jgi:hypothetical protein
MSATLRYNPKHTAIEVTAGGLTWTEEIDSGGDSIMLHHDRGCYVVVTTGADIDGLDNDSVYRLVKETTVVKPEGEIKDDDGTVLG